ncbi:MAG: hypothetical protein ACO34E_17405 [Limisphaerales bacterium]|jgi:hypothetical protein
MRSIRTKSYAWTAARLCSLLCMPILGITLAQETPTVDSPAHPPYPDVIDMVTEPFDDFEDGTVAAGWEALRHRMRGNIYLSNPQNLESPRLTQFERLVRGEPHEVAQVNSEIIDYCRTKKAQIEAAWADPKRRHPAKEVCAYQTELIPLAILSLRIGQRLTPESHEAIRDLILTFRPATADVEPTLWMHAPGYNGANAHDYLSFLVLSWEVTGDPVIRDAAYWGLRRELDHLNLSGDIAEFNVLEGHWCSSNGYDAMKAFLKDPQMARMARMIAERLWINRFLTWSQIVERLTGPGSRMAPGSWLGTGSDRLQFATGIQKPIWLNEFFDWGVYKQHRTGGRWPLDDVEGMLPDLPDYLQDVASRKKLPQTLKSAVHLIPWMERYPKLEGLSHATPEPAFGEMVNHQTQGYTLGSIDRPYEASECMVYASAWWNDHRAPKEEPLGSPKRFSVLFPHYVFNGASFLDRTEIFYEDRPDQPRTDEASRAPGPWIRELGEQGRAGLLQHENTLIYTYSGRNRGPNDVRLVADKVHRISAAMFLFRWQPGLEGIFINRKPVTTLPAEMEPGDWWFIQDGETYVGVRPLEATHLAGPCKTRLEQRTRQIALYQDNYVGDSIEGISDENWVQARSGFIVEMGHAGEYGSFERFRDQMLQAKVNESVDGYVRTISYQRPGRHMELQWHCYLETYLKRRVDGKDVQPTRFLQSPEFAVGSSGEIKTHDAVLKGRPGEAAWLLSASPSKTWVAYQPNPHVQLPLDLHTPVANIQSQRFPFGKLVAQQQGRSLHLEIDAGFRPFWSSAHWRAQIWQEMGTHPSDLFIQTQAAHVTATINGDEMPVTWNEKEQLWTLDPYAKIPRVLDHVQPAGRPPVTTAP